MWPAGQTLPRPALEYELLYRTIFIHKLLSEFLAVCTYRKKTGLKANSLWNNVSQNVYRIQVICIARLKQVYTWII